MFLSCKVVFSKQLRGWLSQDSSHFLPFEGPQMDVQSQPWGLGRKDGLSDPRVLLGKLELHVLTRQGACVFILLSPSQPLSFPPSSEGYHSGKFKF